MKTQAFDIIQFLDDYNIDYITAGKNVSSNWLGINCPYPLCPDPSYHCGINLDSKWHSCWVCGSKGSPLKLIKLLTEKTWSECKAIQHQYYNPELLLEGEEEVIISRRLLFPKEFEKINPDKIPPLVHQYLISRNFNPKFLAQSYSLYYPGMRGNYAFRMIIPIFYKNRMVCFTARAVDNRNPLRYKNCPNEEAEIPINDLLYGYDDHPPNTPIIIVEGITDYWRLGIGSLAIFKSDLTPTQVNLLREKSPSKIIFLLDSDTIQINKAEKLAAKIWFCPVEIAEIDSPDPASLSPKEARDLMQTLLN